MKGFRVLVPLLLVAAFGVNADPAPAACAAPEIRLSPHKVAPGATVTVSGKYFHEGCQDHGGCSTNACGETECDYGPEERPTTDIEITLENDKREYELAEVDAGPRFRFSIDVEIPRHLAPGKYRIVADGLTKAYLRVD